MDKTCALIMVPRQLAKYLYATLLFCGVTFAAEFEGVAPLGMDGAGQARNAAILDALENASLAAGADVKSSTLASNGKNADSLRVRGQPVGGYAVVSEWQTNGFYHIKLDVQPAPRPDATHQAKPACSTDYRRKALITRIPILHPDQVTDLNRLTEELQNELVRRLEYSGQFLPQRTGNEAAMALPANQTEPQWNPDWIRQLARRYAVQFVIGGVLRDAAFEGERYALAYGPNLRHGERKSNLNIPGLSFAQIGFKATPNARRFELDLFVFDGVSGAQMYRQRISGRAEGEVVMDQASFGSDRFFDTDYGQMVETKLNEAVQAISDTVQCIPFSSRITRVEPGRIYLDAGGTSRLAPGDHLQVYRLKSGGRAVDSISFGNPAQLGWPEEIAGSITIKDVQPLFSIGLPEGQLHAEVGDYVRFVGQGGKK